MSGVVIGVQWMIFFVRKYMETVMQRIALKMTGKQYLMRKPSIKQKRKTTKKTKVLATA